MKEYAIDFAYYDWDQLIFTIDWVQCNAPESIREKLEQKYGYVHINNIREMSTPMR